MPNLLTWYVGQRRPWISETITINGVPVNLSGLAVRFKAREGSAILVDQPVSNPLGPDGGVRYDWSIADITAPNGIFSKARHKIEIWWEVTWADGEPQHMMEAFIQCLAHAAVPGEYIELEEFKATLEISNESFADLDIKTAISAASEQVESLTGRRFHPDADANHVRVYSPRKTGRVWIDDLITLTSLKTDPDGDGTFEETWLASDYRLGPPNAALEGRPWTNITRRNGASFWFPTTYGDGVQVTGKFGWNVPPPAVRQATTLIAHRLLKRARDAPFSVAGFGGDGVTVRVPVSDPDVLALLAPFTRRSSII